MAIRPIFLPTKDSVETKEVNFRWFSGFSKSQKIKSIYSLHASAKEELGLNSVLEISTKSESSLGRSLSAFNLPVEISGVTGTVESIYQGSKKFDRGGPFNDLYSASSLEAKKDLRLKSSGDLVSFQLVDKEWPLSPLKGFYSWIYINGLKQKENLNSELLEYAGFTDIEFNPKKSINCQAFCVAAYVVLIKNQRFEEVMSDKDLFLEELLKIDKSDGMNELF